MRQPKKPPLVDPVSGLPSLDAQIQQLREIVERAESVLAELESYETRRYHEAPSRRRARVPVH